MADQLLKEAFDLHDHKGAGQILAEDLGNALRSVGKRLTEESVARLTKKANDELNGTLSFDDFKNYVAEAGQVEKRDEDVKAAFQVFDDTGSGSVNIADLKHALTTLGDKLTMDEVNTLLTDVGHDNSDTINYDKFMSLIAANV